MAEASDVLVVSPATTGGARAESRAGRLDLGADSGNPAVLFVLGMLALREGRHQASVDLLSRAIALDGQTADYHYCLGSAYRGLGRLDRAHDSYRMALRLRPDYVEVHNDLGGLLAGSGQPEEATIHFREAVRLQPANPEAHYNLGLVLRQRMKFDEAACAFEAALAASPDLADAAKNLGNLRARQGRLEQAAEAYRKALRVCPEDFEVHNELGIVLARMRRFKEAEASYREAIRVRPDYPDAHNILGNALRNQGRLDQALLGLREAIRLRPDYPEAYNNVGIVLKYLGKLDEAVASYEQALRLRSNLGIALSRQNRFDEAVAVYRNAIAVKPNFAEAHNNMGNALRNSSRFEESLECYRKALEIKPDYADAHNNLGIAYAELARFDEAIASYTSCLKIRPQHVDAHMNRALIWLRKGDYAQGWAEYEWRWKKRSLTPRPPIMPQWNGFPLAGRKILLITEQGFGDTMQFVRFAPLLKRQGAGAVILECPEKLVKLLARTPGIDHLVPQGKPLPDYDVYCALLNVPGLTATSIEAIPADVPYIFPDPELVEHWRRELAVIPGFKVGINWQGNPKYAGDRHRSIPLTSFEPLSRVPGVKLFSIQKNDGREQLDKLEGRFAVTDLGRRLDEGTGPFLDTAAVLKNLDLFITSDTAVAHLAGALGVPVWMALSTTPDWRWMTNREDNPWYPTMGIFRQDQHMVWGPVFERMAAELNQIVPARTRTLAVNVAIAPGELIDKITILEIKAQRIADPAKLRNVRNELESLRAARDLTIVPSEELDSLTADLRSINELLWDVEDEIRACERNSDFGPRFVELARSVYQNNDRRAAVKRRINERLGSRILEEKSYTGRS